MASKGIEPVFVRDRDLKTRDITPFIFCQAMERVIGKGKVEGAQLISHMWRLYVKDKESRVKLLAKKELLVVNRNVEMFDQNPGFLKKTVQQMDKLTIKHVPLSVDNKDVAKMLEENGVKMMSEIKFSCERDLDGNTTTYKNGDRFVFIQQTVSPVTRSQKVCGHTAVIIHHGKDNKPCLACNLLGHRVGSTDCPAKPTEKIYTFRGYRHPLSNHYPCDLEIFDNHFKSVEHAFFWRMAKDFGKDVLATDIKESIHAGAAKAMSKDIAPEEERHVWERDAGDGVMKELLYEKCRQVPEFLRCVYDHREFIFAEANPSRIWATAMSEFVTRNTTPENWIGENRLGQMITEIAQNIDGMIIELGKKGGVEKMYYDLGFNIRPEMLEDGEDDVFEDVSKKEWIDKYGRSTDIEDQTVKAKSIPTSTPVTTKGDKERETEVIAESQENVGVAEGNPNKASHSTGIPFRVKKTAVKKLKDESRKARRASLPATIGKEKNMEQFLDYLDRKYDEITTKRKTVTSSPDKSLEQELKMARVGED